MGMDEFAFSLKMRDVIDKMVTAAIDRARPRYRYATVNSIDRSNWKCTVTFVGETSPVVVSMGSIQPNASGQRVRVEGIGTDKYIADVIGEPYFHSPIGDPNADRILFWDDSGGAYRGLVPSSPGLSISGTTLSVPLASTSTAGRIRVATEEEALVGTTSAAAVVPANLPRVLLPVGQTSASKGTGWDSYGSGYTYPAYWKDGSGTVHLQGLLRRTGASTTSAVSGLIVLPEGCRPGGTLVCNLITSNGPFRFDINTSGSLFTSTSATWATGSWISLTGISFKAQN